MGASVSNKYQTIQIRKSSEQNKVANVQILNHQQLKNDSEVQTSNTKKQNIGRNGGKANNDDKMCDKIYENNRKCSIIRKNSKLKNSASMNVQNNMNNMYNSNKSTVYSKYQRNNGQQDLDSKLKYFQNNKKLIQSSIQATICVERVLNVLCHRDILRNDEFNYLNAKNLKSLECKQKRYRNLEVRQQRAKQSHNPFGESETAASRIKYASSFYQQKENKFPHISKYQNKSSYTAGKH